MVMQVGLDVWKMVLELFRQVLRVTDPAAGLAGARRLVVAQFAVQGFYKFYAFAKRLAKFLVGLVVAMHEVFEALVPAAITLAVAGVAALAGRRVKTFVGIIAFFDELPDEYTGIRERFYQLSSHDPLLSA